MENELGLFVIIYQLVFIGFFKMILKSEQDFVRQSFSLHLSAAFKSF